MRKLILLLSIIFSNFIISLKLAEKFIAIKEKDLFKLYNENYVKILK